LGKTWISMYRGIIGPQINMIREDLTMAYYSQIVKSKNTKKIKIYKIKAPNHI
jgi:hypothetical protein